MIYTLTEAHTFRSVTFRVSLRELVADFKRTLHGSLLRKLTPPPITPTPLALRRWRRLALAKLTQRLCLTAIGNGDTAIGLRMIDISILLSAILRKVY